MLYLWHHRYQRKAHLTQGCKFIRKRGVTRPTDVLPHHRLVLTESLNLARDIVKWFQVVTCNRFAAGRDTDRARPAPGHGRLGTSQWSWRNICLTVILRAASFTWVFTSTFQHSPLNPLFPPIRVVIIVCIDGYLGPNLKWASGGKVSDFWSSARSQAVTFHWYTGTIEIHGEPCCVGHPPPAVWRIQWHFIKAQTSREPRLTTMLVDVNI